MVLAEIESKQEYLDYINPELGVVRAAKFCSREDSL